MPATTYDTALVNLSRGAPHVVDDKGRFYWNARAAAPWLPAGSWYLHSGGRALPTGLAAMLTKPDGSPWSPLTTSPDAKLLISGENLGTVVWKNKASCSRSSPR